MPYAELAPSSPPRPLTRAEVREVDLRATEELGVPGAVLMENAGAGLMRVLLAELEALGAAPGAEVGVVCGKGNNGGDGFVVARHLALHGFRPRVAYGGALAEADRTSDAGVNLAILEKSGLDVAEAPDGEALAALLERWKGAALVVDALFGTGLASALREPGLGQVRALAAAPQPVVSVDIPSGLDCDTGQPLGAAVGAIRTATFVGRKQGFAAEGARDYTGEVVVVHIGCPTAAWSHVVE